MKTLRIASSRKYIELHGITSIHSLRLHWEKRPSERCFSAGLISWADVLFLQRQELRISRWRGRASDLEVLLGKEKSGSRNDRTENAEAGFTLKSIEHFLLRFKFRYTDYSLIREHRFILTLISTLSPYLILSTRNIVVHLYRVQVIAIQEETLKPFQRVVRSFAVFMSCS